VSAAPPKTTAKTLPCPELPLAVQLLCSGTAACLLPLCCLVSLPSPRTDLHSAPWRPVAHCAPWKRQALTSASGTPIPSSLLAMNDRAGMEWPLSPTWPPFHLLARPSRAPIPPPPPPSAACTRPPPRTTSPNSCKQALPLLAPLSAACRQEAASGRHGKLHTPQRSLSRIADGLAGRPAWAHAITLQMLAAHASEQLPLPPPASSLKPPRLLPYSPFPSGVQPPGRRAGPKCAPGRLLPGR
jgi:hypothetical protein